MHNFLENKLKGKGTHIKKRYSSRSCLNDFTITCITCIMLYAHPTIRPLYLIYLFLSRVVLC